MKALETEAITEDDMGKSTAGRSHAPLPAEDADRIYSMWQYDVNILFVWNNCRNETLVLLYSRTEWKRHD